MSKSVTVRYRGLEILCLPDTVYKYRKGLLAKSKVLITDDTIYKDVKKGNVASEKDIEKALGSPTSINDAIEYLLQKGDYQITSKERQEMNVERRNQLLEHFHQYYLDPKTDSPYPISTLDATFVQIKAKVNYEVSFNRNAEDIRKAMLGILPIKPRDNVPSFQSNTVGEKEKVKPSSAAKTKFGRKKGGKSRHY